MKRVALAVENQLTRAGMETLISQLSGQYQIVASAEYAHRIHVEKGNSPEILVIVDSPEKNPDRQTDGIVQLKGKCGLPPLTTMLLCGSIKSAVLSRMIRIGVKAVLKHDAAPETIFGALALLPEHQIIDDGLVIDERLLTTTLSQREFEVGRMLAVGLSVKEIASEKALSVKTVEAHKTNLMGKLGLHRRADVANFFNRHGGGLNGWFDEEE